MFPAITGRLFVKPLLPGKVAIINGGATGMGRSTALIFASEGCSCVIADTNEKDGLRTAEEATANGKECLFVRCDITDLKQIRACVDGTVAKFGRVDILVGCAGGSVPGGASARPRHPDGTPKTGIEYADEKFFDMMTALNYKGHVFFCKEVVPYMKKQRYGKIVLISSMGVYSPPGPAAEYHGAKGAIIGLVNNLAFELGPSNINVNGVLPGPVKTPFWDPVLAQVPEEERDAMMDRVGRLTPLGRVGLPEDIAYTVLFLCSEMSSYITGQMINVSGGIPLERYREGGGVLRRVEGG
jgi:NAD(P)-dependent dehydrogenase (short-subunit alcohol dehydrogenase family)